MTSVVRGLFFFKKTTKKPIQTLFLMPTLFESHPDEFAKPYGQVEKPVLLIFKKAGKAKKFVIYYLFS